MNELPVFICYRQDDGADLAQWLHRELHGRTLIVKSSTRDWPATITVYLDRGSAAVADWQNLHFTELQRSKAFIIVCSPGAKYEFNNEDWVHREMRWWIENRSAIPPILVTKLGERWVPDLISDRWPKAQLVKIDFNELKTLPASEREYLIERSIQSILGGISASMDNTGPMNPETGVMNAPGLFTWEKDAQFRYIRCNENYARAAGFDSPHALLGKTDDDMPWHTLADAFRIGDNQVISGKGPPRFHIQEKEIMVDRVADILVTENQLLDKVGKCVGVTGYYIDITGSRLVPRSKSSSNCDNGVKVGNEYDDAFLSKEESEVLKKVLLTFPIEKIAIDLNLSRGEIESHFHSLKLKLQCSTYGDIIATTIRSGLPLTVFGPKQVIATTMSIKD